MPFVVALDERFDHADLELGRRRRQRLLNLIEREHDLEAVLELGLRDLGVARELVPHARIETARVGRGQIAGRPRLGLAAPSR